MDPYGHLAPWLFKETMDKDDVEIRPTIAITRAHMKVPEMENSVKEGRITVDGKICVNDMGEIAVTKVAVEPVWYLPGVAERFNIGEYDNNSVTSLSNISFRRGYTQKDALRRNWWLVPRTHYTPRHQALPSAHRRSHCLHLWRPSEDV